MSVVAGFWATAGMLALTSGLIALSAITATYVRTARNMYRLAGVLLGVAVASSITAIWLAVAGL